ncbi:BON domain-containing protein [Legionella dresdenensis]|uniref:BON domain-containing protein n=1 Tax=Legionella dresdenensis TaxID=450200 RepID=A0ABV8CEJ6_9GAMM
MRIFLSLILSIVLIAPITAVRAENHISDIEKSISDSVITTKITAKFAKNRGLNPLKISVSTQDGVVTLSGYVKDRQAFVDALTIAKTTKGVKTVDAEELMIKQVNTRFTDAYITAKVEATILKAKVFDDESIPLVGINASTDNGTVTLTGEVKKEKSVGAIIKRVSAIKGVKKIISHLKVNRDEQ